MRFPLDLQGASPSVALRASLMASTPLWSALLASHAMAACASSADSLTLNCGGTLTAPITVYDAAAAFQPVNGSNSYTPANPAFPAASNPNNPGYNPNPPTVTLNFDNTAAFNVTTNSSASYQFLWTVTRAGFPRVCGFDSRRRNGVRHAYSASR